MLPHGPAASPPGFSPHHLLLRLQSLGGKSHRGPLGTASFLQPCTDAPSARKKPNLTRDSYLGQRNAEMRERKNVRRGISVPLPGFCSLSEIQALIYSNRRVLIIDLQPPHPTHCHWEMRPTAAIPTPTQLRQARTQPDGTLPFWTHVCRGHAEFSCGGWSTSPCLQHAPPLLEALDLIAWSLWIHAWDIQNGSQITFFHWESQDPCNSWETPGFSVCLTEEKRGMMVKGRWAGEENFSLTTDTGIC